MTIVKLYNKEKNTHKVVTANTIVYLQIESDTSPQRF